MDSTTVFGTVSWGSSPYGSTNGAHHTNVWKHQRGDPRAKRVWKHQSNHFGLAFGAPLWYDGLMNNQIKVEKETPNSLDIIVDEDCAVNWIAKHYSHFNGKLVEIDGVFLNHLKAHADNFNIKKRKDGTIIVNTFAEAGFEDGMAYPSTKVKVESYDVGCGKRRNFVTEIDAEDIPNFGFVAKPNDSQILYLKSI